MKKNRTNGAITRDEMWRRVEPIYEEILPRVAKKLELDDPEDVREPLHTVLARIARRPKELREWKPYLIRSTINEIRHGHKNRREVSFSELSPEERRHLFEERAGDCREPWEIASQRELEAKAMAELWKLPPQQRTVILLRINGLSTAEIARQLGIRPTSVRSHWRHGLKTLRSKFRMAS